jgi:hypothetical protein
MAILAFFFQKYHAGKINPAAVRNFGYKEKKFGTDE